MRHRSWNRSIHTIVWKIVDGYWIYTGELEYGNKTNGCVAHYFLMWIFKQSQVAVILLLYINTATITWFA